MCFLLKERLSIFKKELKLFWRQTCTLLSIDIMNIKNCYEVCSLTTLLGWFNILNVFVMSPYISSTWVDLNNLHVVFFLLVLHLTYRHTESGWTVLLWSLIRSISKNTLCFNKQHCGCIFKFQYAHLEWLHVSSSNITGRNMKTETNKRESGVHHVTEMSSILLVMS